MFIKKNVVFTDMAGKRVIDTTKDIVDIGTLLPGRYNVSVSYALTVPPGYPKEISDLEAKYGIALTVREKIILGIYPLWGTRGVIYTPKHVTISHLDGQLIS